MRFLRNEGSYYSHCSSYRYPFFACISSEFALRIAVTFMTGDVSASFEGYEHVHMLPSAELECASKFIKDESWLITITSQLAIYCQVEQLDFAGVARCDGCRINSMVFLP